VCVQVHPHQGEANRASTVEQAAHCYRAVDTLLGFPPLLFGVSSLHFCGVARGGGWCWGWALFARGCGLLLMRVATPDGVSAQWNESDSSGLGPKKSLFSRKDNSPCVRFLLK